MNPEESIIDTSLSETTVNDYLDKKIISEALAEENTLFSEALAEENTSESISKKVFSFKPFKLGKDYKKSKLYFLNNYSKYIEYNKDNKKLEKITVNVISKIYDYIDIFLINDLEDLVNILYKRNTNNIETKMQIFSYIDNIFNENVYILFIEKYVKNNYNKLIKNKTYIENKDNKIFEDFINKNTLLYVGIIRTEILKILMLKMMITNHLLYFGYIVPLDENFIKNNKIIKHLDYFPVNEYLKYNDKIVNSFHQLIMKSKRLILFFYNDLKKNFSFCNNHIDECKTMIIYSNILN
jgi:hypothetical protein